jgi:hypothetical protein
MGASQSVPTIQDQENEQIMEDIENKKVMIDKALSNNITELGTLLGQFQKNDTMARVDKIKSMDEFKGKVPDTVLAKVSEAHKNVLDSLDNTLLSPEDRNNQLSTDNALSNYIQKSVNKDLDEKMKTYLANPFIEGDPVVKKSMSEVTNSIKTIRGKYKFFEYKYLQLNVFMILFVKHIHNTVKKFIDETVTFYEAREKYHLVLIHNVVKTFQQQLGDETQAMVDLDTETFGKALRVLTESVMDSMNKQKTLADKMKQNSLQEILKFLMNREADFAKDIIAGVEGYKSANPQSPSEIEGRRVEGPENRAKFIASSTAAGMPQGYKFQNGEQGLGFYLNSRPGPERPSFGPLPRSSSLGSSYNQPLPGMYGPTSRPQFIPSSQFTGRRDGYVYATRDQGTGYYRNSRGGFIRGSSMLPQKFFEL